MIREARERSGLTQFALARKVSMTQAQISRLESGQRSTPGFDTIAKIATATNSSLDSIAIEAGFMSDESTRAPTATELRALAERLARARRSVLGLEVELRNAVDFIDVKVLARATAKKR